MYQSIPSPTISSPPNRGEFFGMRDTLQASLTESAGIFYHVLFRPLYGTLSFITIYHAINAKFFELPQCFAFRVILRTSAILRTFVFYFHYGDSISSEKINGHHTFESISLVGAFIFLLKQHTS